MIDEHLLVEQARNGDKHAFRELVDRHKIRVYRLAYDLTGNPADAEDLSQDVFIKAYRSLHNFRGDAKFNTWLYRITVNTCYDHHSKKSNSMMTLHSQKNDEDDSIELQHESPAVSPEQSAEASIIQKDIESALEKLSPREKAVFMLRHYHDLPLKEIAETLEISVGTVKALLFRAVKRLQEHLSYYKQDLGLVE